MNIKNKLSAQVLRIAALALAISLIFGSMAVFYAEETTPQEPTTVAETNEEETTPSSSEETTPSSSEETTPSSSEETTPSSSEETTPSSSEETTPSEPEEEPYVPVKPYSLFDDGGLWETITLSDIKAMGDGGSMAIDISDEIGIEDANGHYICSLAKACREGATVEIKGGKTHHIDDKSYIVEVIPAPKDEGPAAFYVYQTCLAKADETTNNKVQFTLPITVTLADGTVISDTMIFTLLVSEGSGEEDPEDPDSPGAGGDTENTTKATTTTTTTTTTKTASTTKVKGSSASNKTGTPNTGDITTANDNPARDAAAVGMLTVGLLIAAGVAVERILRARADRKRRANAIRR